MCFDSFQYLGNSLRVWLGIATWTMIEQTHEKAVFCSIVPVNNYIVNR